MGFIAPICNQGAPMFRPGNLVKLLNTLGVKYGAVCGENTAQIFVTSIEQAEMTLGSLFQGGRIPQKEYEDDILAVRKSGMCETEVDFYRAFATYKLSKDRPKLTFTFVPCPCKLIPLPHGEIVQDGIAIGPHITVLNDGASFVLNHTLEDVIPVNDGIRVMQQMIGYNMPLTEDDLAARFRALPEKVQLNFYRTLEIGDLITIVDHPRYEETTADDQHNTCH